MYISIMKFLRAKVYNLVVKITVYSLIFATD